MKTIKFIFRSLAHFRPLWLAMVFAMFYVAIDKNIKPYLIKNIIDLVNSGDFSKIWYYVIIFIVMQFGLVAAWYAYDWCKARLEPALSREIAENVMSKIEQYPYRFFQENLSGKIASRFSDLARYVPKLLDTATSEFFMVALLIIFALGFIGYISLFLAAGMIVWIAAFVSMSLWTFSKADKMSRLKAEAYNDTWANITDCIANIFTVKVFARFNHEKRLLRRDLDEFYNKSLRTDNFLVRYYLVQGVVFSCYMVICLIVCIRLVAAQKMTAGDFALICMLNFEIVSWLFYLVAVSKDFIMHLGTVNQALTLLNYQPELQDNIGAQPLAISRGEIAFNDVEFYYSRLRNTFSALELASNPHESTEKITELHKDRNKNTYRYNLVLKPEQKVGLVGYSGSGKSTLINLILRLYDVTGGSICIDGQDIRTCTQDSLREQITLVPQDPALFCRSVLDNLRYGNPDATQAEVEIAAKKALAHDFILGLPQGYDTIVGEKGAQLSGGQRQRLAIARAMLKNSRIVLMDEITSQMDAITELELQKSIANLMQGKTSIIIAHRLVTVSKMDRLLVFDSEGNIVADGTHAELIQDRDGVYKRLWEGQINGILASGVMPNPESGDRSQ